MHRLNEISRGTMHNSNISLYKQFLLIKLVTSDKEFIVSKTVFIRDSLDHQKYSSFVSKNVKIIVSIIKTKGQTIQKIYKYLYINY